MNPLDEGTKAIIEKISRSIIDRVEERWEEKNTDLYDRISKSIKEVSESMQKYCTNTCTQLRNQLDEHRTTHLSEKTELDKKIDRNLIKLSILVSFVVGISAAIKYFI